ncbi:Uncharacterised protein [Mycobacterium tuberculosis]|nr:Uncharacterised protein [Mycobacterium tuberculosis]
MPHAWATAFDQVVRPKTPRGDGNFSDHLCGISGLRSSDPKPREGTETWDICCPPGEMLSEVVRPKTPRGDGNQVSNGGGNLAATGRSSDPKPREGTETGQRSTPALVDFRVVRPKTPRGDGNQVSNGGGNLAATGRSSDPKPREGTETRQQSRRPARMTPVVRPKTPRGDGNMGYLLPARGDAVRGRQTQNPERGRKLDCANWLGADPGGRQTQNPERGRKPHGPGRAADGPGGRQTQNPERGRKLHIDFLDLARREDHVVRPKTPREDGNSSTIASMSMSQSSSRQTQNPERGRKPSAQHR